MSSTTFASGTTSLEELGTVLATNGIEAALTRAENYTYISDVKKLIRISNVVKEQGTNKQLTPDWSYFIQDEPGANLRISLPLRHHYIDEVSFSSYENKHECSYNLASSGIKIYANKNDTFISESWSCGSAGCSFTFNFSERRGRSYEELCKDL